jgi:hypothetical protein
MRRERAAFTPVGRYLNQHLEEPLPLKKASAALKTGEKDILDALESESGLSYETYVMTCGSTPCAVCSKAAYPLRRPQRRRGSETVWKPGGRCADIWASFLGPTRSKREGSKKAADILCREKIRHGISAAIFHAGDRCASGRSVLSGS